LRIIRLKKAGFIVCTRSRGRWWCSLVRCLIRMSQGVGVLSFRPWSSESCGESEKAVGGAPRGLSWKGKDGADVRMCLRGRR